MPNSMKTMQATMPADLADSNHLQWNTVVEDRSRLESIGISTTKRSYCSIVLSVAMDTKYPPSVIIIVND
jgi:hypothetical protein